MSSNSTGAADLDESGYPFHTFPESKWESINSALAPISIIGTIAFAIVHYRHDPYLASFRRIRAIIGVVVAIYIVPASFIAGSSNDEATTGLLVASAIVEIAINAFLFRKNPKHRVGTRIGGRALFASMCVLVGASMGIDAYNDVDYYGPVRVTDVALEAHRPEQQVDKYDPRYYYYYQLVQTLEWGDSWGCPGGEEGGRWCSASEELYPKECSVRIDCKGKPNAGDVGECAGAERQAEAFEALFLCWAKNALNDGLGLDDFANANFTRTVAPWEDPSNPHTVTRSVSCGKPCSAKDTGTPEQLAEKASWYGIVGGLMSLVGFATLLWGIKHDKEVHPMLFRPVPARIVMETATASEVSSLSNDVELASNIPVAQAVPA